LIFCFFSPPELSFLPFILQKVGFAHLLCTTATTPPFPFYNCLPKSNVFFLNSQQKKITFQKANKSYLFCYYQHFHPPWKFSFECTLEIYCTCSLTRLRESGLFCKKKNLQSRHGFDSAAILLQKGKISRPETVGGWVEKEPGAPFSNFRMLSLNPPL